MKADLPRINTPDRAINQTFDYILSYWPSLTQQGETLYLPLPGRWVRPGGFFNMFFYWDSYFIILGLVIQGKWQLAREIVDNLIFEVETIGHIPNYNSPKRICKSRSQPPCLTIAIKEVYPFINDKAWLEKAINAASAEYSNYWMSDPHITDTGLSRYIDTGKNGCSTVPDTIHHRGIAESGWDNTPRFGNDIRDILPVDLNCLLYQYEVDLEQFYKILGKHDESNIWSKRAKRRKNLINDYFWDDNTKFYRDYDLKNATHTQNVPLSLSSYLPLWCGVSNKNQALDCAKKISLFERNHGLSTCEEGYSDNTQWNYPVGWAPLHWFVLIGLRRYNFNEEARRITMKWLRLNAHKFMETGVLREKYNITDIDARLPGRYGPQRGFGWTNGVFVALLIRVIFGLDYKFLETTPQWDPILPPTWKGKVYELYLPDYPWPKGYPKQI